jgi:hypothetical protein
MLASLADGIAGSAGTIRRGLDLGLSSSPSTMRGGHGTAADISFDVESSECSLSDAGLDSSSSSMSHVLQNDAAVYADLLWNSPLSSPRSAGHVSDAEAAITMRPFSGVSGHARLCALSGSSAVLVAGGSQCCHLCCCDRLMTNSDQPVCFAGRYLGRQLSDSVLPDVCSERQIPLSSDDRVVASSSSFAAQPSLS